MLKAEKTNNKKKNNWKLLNNTKFVQNKYGIAILSSLGPQSEIQQRLTFHLPTGLYTKQGQIILDIFQSHVFTNPNNCNHTKSSNKTSYWLGKSIQGFFVHP